MIALLILSLVQGITEFIPVSSSLHLEILRSIFNFDLKTIDPQLFDSLLHIGTLFAIIIFFFKDILAIFISVFKVLLSHLKLFKKSSDNKYVKKDKKIIKITSKKLENQDQDNVRLFLKICIAFLPTALIGFIVKFFIILPDQTKFATKLMAGSSIVFGTLLFFVDRFCTKKKETIAYKDAFLIGLFQSFAFIPGASRLGCTLTMSRFLGISRISSIKFSFLLSIPTVLGATFLSVLKFISHNSFSLFIQNMPILPIFLTAFVGSLTIKMIFKYLEKGSFAPFLIYRIIIGAIILFI